MKWRLVTRLRFSMNSVANEASAARSPMTFARPKPVANLEPQRGADISRVQRVTPVQRSFAPFSAHVLAKEESFAEKTRAALSRTEPAIRDFFDIEAIFQSGFDLHSVSFLRLVQQKLKADTSAQLNLTHEKKSVLLQQIDTDLKMPETF
jgi:hypothetical protein